MEIREKLERFLRDRPRLRREVSDRFGRCRKDAFNILEDLVTSGLVKARQEQGLRGKPGMMYEWAGGVLPHLKEPPIKIIPVENLRPCEEESLNLPGDYMVLVHAGPQGIKISPVRDAGTDPRITLLREENERLKGKIADLEAEAEKKVKGLQALRDLLDSEEK